ncbi:hypothetical protein ACIP5N_21915 [Streptomyces sp. NPDC088768]|uniref:hypothetical protein n=1 Tax=Streptomyces sp. NPDC088768 TaxID=3365894 RepID=UPI003800FCA7
MSRHDVLMDEESPAADLTPAAVRRRFTAAAWGSAAAWPALTTAVAFVLLWWLDIARDEMMTADFAGAGLYSLVLMLLYLADDAVRTVRKEQKEVAEDARGLVFAAQGGDPSVLRTARAISATRSCRPGARSTRGSFPGRRPSASLAKSSARRKSVD